MIKELPGTSHCCRFILLPVGVNKHLPGRGCGVHARILVLVHHLFSKQFLLRFLSPFTIFSHCNLCSDLSTTVLSPPPSGHRQRRRRSKLQTCKQRRRHSGGMSSLSCRRSDPLSRCQRDCTSQPAQALPWQEK